jgi:DNA-binding NarL/FixJ family response regulator
MPRSTPVTVAIGHFEDLLGRGLRGLVEDDPSLSLIASGVTRGELPRLLRSRRPRVAIVDHGSLRSPVEVRALASRHPATRLVLVADQLSGAECAQLLAFGAAACVGRATQARDVISAVHLASRGMQLIPRELDHPPIEPGLLTARESEVLAELQRRRANAQIASDLHISVETVRTHARSIYRKLGVSSRRELLAPITMPEAIGQQAGAAWHGLADPGSGSRAPAA